MSTHRNHGSTPQQARRTNQGAILRRLLSSGPANRGELAAEMGLSAGSVTRVLGTLVDAGVVRDMDPVISGRGRPMVPVDVAEESRHIIAVHIGLDHITAGRLTLGGRIDARDHRPHTGSITEVLDLITNVVAGLVASSPAPLLGVGLALSGSLDEHAQIIHRHPLLPWRDVSLADLLAPRLDIPLFVGSNIAAHALADMTWGRVQTSNFAHLYVGNMVELAIVVEGVIRSGSGVDGAGIDDVLIPLDDDTVGRCADLLTDRSVVARALEQGLSRDQVSFDTPLEDQGPVMRELLGQRAAHVGKLILHLDGLIGLDDVVVSSGVLASQGQLTDVARVLEQSGRQHSPRLIPGGSVEESLLQAAAAVVVAQFLNDPIGSAGTPLPTG